MYGLHQNDIENISSIFQSENAIEEAIIFGSRAKGNFKEYSDVDIALKGGNINHSTITHISYILNEETTMPYKFDVVNYHSIHNKDLVEHIDRVGKVFYKHGESIPGEKKNK
jgi:predicted nucleotidyltransferase